MERLEITKCIDHTMLSAEATWEKIKKICNEAIENKTASVCIPPSYVKKAKSIYGNQLTICTVIGFPLGYSTITVKEFETIEAIKDGADEIDMVINIAQAKDGNYDYILNEIKTVKKACNDKILKVIIETCYLTREEKITLCKIVSEANADFIKTSTGFGTAGATHEDIDLFKANISKNVKIKAAGGVKNLEDLIDYINQGCSRIGTSSGIAMINNLEIRKFY